MKDLEFCQAEILDDRVIRIKSKDGSRIKCFQFGFDAAFEWEGIQIHSSAKGCYLFAPGTASKVWKIQFSGGEFKIFQVIQGQNVQEVCK